MRTTYQINYGGGWTTITKKEVKRIIKENCPTMEASTLAVLVRGSGIINIDKAQIRKRVVEGKK